MSLKVVFMGTPDFAVPTLQKLIDRKDNIVAVITQPDKPKGRGQQLAPPPVKTLALENSLTVYQPKKVREEEFVEKLKEMAPDVIVVVAFGQILPKSILDIPPLGCINIHASLLPKYRGAAPLNWVLVNGEKETGITTMLMDVGLDTGDMLLKYKTPIDKDEDILTLHNRLSTAGADLLDETLKKLVSKEITPEKQIDEDSCYAPMLKKEDGLINWERTSLEIHNQVRGFSVWPTAYTTLNQNVLKVFKTEIGTSRGKAGEVLAASKGKLEIATGDSSLILKEVQLAGKKRQPVDSFLSGVKINVGDKLGE